MSKTYDISNNIIIPEYLFYPSLYKSDYNDISNNNYFILESSKPIDLTLWKNSIIIDSSNNISINHKILSKLIIELQNSIIGHMNYYGKSFSKKPIKIGNLYQYYMQYIANFIFGHPAATEPFKNDKTIKKNISNIIDSIIDTFYDNDALKIMIFEQFLKDDVIQFSENDILQFKVTIQPPDIFITKIHQLNIPTTHWNIIIKMNSKK
jgi:hypothetical protein